MSDEGEGWKDVSGEAVERDGLGRPLPKSYLRERDSAIVTGEGAWLLVPRFRPHVRCVKCGSESVHKVSFVEVTKDKYPAFLRQTGLHDCLWRTCLTCSFGWPERPLDDE